MKKILYTVAKDKNGNLIKAIDAEKGNEFYCPKCKSKLILRKSGRTGKGTKRPHFAHRNLTPNCTPETALHFSFKTLLADKLGKLIQEQKQLIFSWDCEYCGDTHSGNLLKKIKYVKVEYNLNKCQPDIALLDENENVFAVIEIVVTHKPEDDVLKYYTKNNIILIQIELTSDEDIENLEEKISFPDRVTVCFNPKCKDCGNYQQKKIMTVIDGPCWKCGKPMKIATISSSTGGLMRGSSNHLSPSDFTGQEIKFAKSKGVILKTQYSKTVRDRYIANTCPNCGAFAGDFYLFKDYIAPAGYGELPYETYDIGYYCEYCDEKKYEDEDY